jgi:hypothetical protein
MDSLASCQPAVVVQCTGSGKVKPRPNVLRLMDEARGEGLKVAVCSAATKSSCIFVVEKMLGLDRYKVSAAGLEPCRTQCKDVKLHVCLLATPLLALSAMP